MAAPAATAATTATARPDGLSPEQAESLASLARVDDYPLYTMRYAGPYPRAAAELPVVAGSRPQASQGSGADWACSLFAALADPEQRLYGRNFDWRFSPALLLFTDPPDGYASVSMVDIEYFGFGDGAVDLTTLPLAKRQALLGAVFMPFDGMNAAGVAVGMAAVPQADTRHDAGKRTVGEIAVIREVLDHAANVDEAVAILKQYNIDWEGGPALHYLVADRSGHAALVEFHGGEIVVMPEAGSWHAATNFTRSAVASSPTGQCWRYDTLVARLTASDGKLTPATALDLLQSVAQSETVTQWSVIYGMSTGQIDVVMGRHFDRVHTFELNLASP